MRRAKDMAGLLVQVDGTVGEGIVLESGRGASAGMDAFTAEGAKGAEKEGDFRRRSGEREGPLLGDET